MLIVVSDAAFRQDESTLLNAMFEEGLQIFHLRKPDSKMDAVVDLLRAIEPMHHSKVSLHQHHQLADKFNLTRIHHPEVYRKRMNKDELQLLKQKGYSLSTSVHDLQEAVMPVYAYSFFGPVFDSISKQGYSAKIDGNAILPPARTKRIAIGGINATNCAKALDMGFDGVAVLGAVWRNTDPVTAFKKIQKACQHVRP